MIQSSFGMSLVEISNEDQQCKLISDRTLVKKINKISSLKKRFSKSMVIKRKRAEDSLFDIDAQVLSSLETVTINNSGTEGIFSGFSTGVNTVGRLFLLRNINLDLKVSLKKSFLSLESDEDTAQSPLISDFGLGVSYSIKQKRLKKLSFNVGAKYRTISYYFTNDSTNAISEFNISGFSLDADVFFPLSKKFTIVSKVGFLLFPTTTFESSFLGSLESSSRYELFIGGVVKGVMSYDLFGGVNIESTNINFSGQNTKMEVSNIGAIAGVKFYL